MVAGEHESRFSPPVRCRAMTDNRPADDDPVDPTRRTRLASERTVLAWLRTGLTATAVALAVGKVVPELGGGGAHWPFVAIGAGYAVLGVVIVIYGMVRGRQVDRALDEGRYVGLNDAAMWVIGSISAFLALATVVVLFASS
jgi:inner membrane protein YidH